jgi:hypothetical protein
MVTSALPSSQKPVVERVDCSATVRPFGSIPIRWASTKEAGPHVM